MSNEEFQEFYQQYHGFSAAVARGIAKDSSVAEDVYQDVFMYLYRIRNRIDLSNPKKVKALIILATVNKCRDYYRKPKHRYEVSLDEDKRIRSDERANPEQKILKSEEDRILKEVLDELKKTNPVNYEILIKTKVLGISADEVAEEYGISRNNVNNRVFRSRNWLRKRLKEKRR